VAVVFAALFVVVIVGSTGCSYLSYVGRCSRMGYKKKPRGASTKKVLAVAAASPPVVADSSVPVVEPLLPSPTSSTSLGPSTIIVASTTASLNSSEVLRSSSSSSSSSADLDAVNSAPQVLLASPRKVVALGTLPSKGKKSKIAAAKMLLSKSEESSGFDSEDEDACVGSDVPLSTSKSKKTRIKKRKMRAQK
jgi:hypothetical protein